MKEDCKKLYITTLYFLTVKSVAVLCINYMVKMLALNMSIFDKLLFIYLYSTRAECYSPVRYIHTKPKVLSATIISKLGEYFFNNIFRGYTLLVLVDNITSFYTVFISLVHCFRKIDTSSVK